MPEANPRDTNEPAEEFVPTWDGRFESKKEMPAYRELVDLLHGKQWDLLVSHCETDPEIVNLVVESADTRDGRWSTVLHQCLHDQAPLRLFEALLDRGAFASASDAHRQMPWKLARALGMSDHASLLRRPVTMFPFEARRTQAVFHGLLKSFFLAAASNIRPYAMVRLPEIVVLKECKTRPPDALWFPILGMMGGFRFCFDPDPEHANELLAEAWSRMDGGPPTQWRITPGAAIEIPPTEA